jgi:hypothetical protein
MSVSYSKEMRETAKLRGTHLITIDTPFICYQTPAGTDAEVDELTELLTRWFEEHNKKPKGKRNE